MEKFNIIQLLNKAETKVNSTMLSKIRKTEINLILLEIKKLAIDYTHSCKSDSEQLFCYHEGSYTLNEDGTCCKCHRLPKPKAK